MEKTIIKAIKDNLTAALSGAGGLIVAAGLTDITNYTEYYMDNEEESFLAVYPAEATKSEDTLFLTAVVQVQLPKVLNVQDYSEVIWGYVKGLDADDFNATQMESSCILTYPGDFGSGFGGSFILIEIRLTIDLDSCDY